MKLYILKVNIYNFRNKGFEDIKVRIKAMELSEAALETAIDMIARGCIMLDFSLQGAIELKNNE